MSHLQNLPELDPILTDPDFLFPTGPAFLNQFATLDAIPEEEAQWLIPGWLPQGQLALLAADGGTGKTGFWCQLLAALSRGESTLLDTEKITRPPLTAAFFSAEDSVRKKLKKRLRLCGARMVNLVTLEFRSPALWDLRLGSKELAQFIGAYRPALCVLDPIQGFLPDGVNMASRNEIRACLAPLISLGGGVRHRLSAGVPHQQAGGRLGTDPFSGQRRPVGRRPLCVDDGRRWKRQALSLSGEEQLRRATAHPAVHFFGHRHAPPRGSDPQTGQGVPAGNPAPPSPQAGGV